jgi:hypothetical protein
LTLWKKSLPGREAPKSKGTPDRFRELRKEIVVMRKQGEPPVKDPGSFAQYMCDLCSTPHPVSGLRQCVLCGRWACDACWKDDYYTCKSCAGLIKIHSLMGRE